MVYWNNPTLSVKYPNNVDPIVQSTHGGQHCLFYDPALPITKVEKLVTVQDTCDLANQWMRDRNSITEAGDLDKIYKLVRINLFFHSLRNEGNHKPILVQYTGTWPLLSSTGGTRFMAAELCPEITAFPAFISTHCRFRSQFDHLEEITNFDTFAGHCKAQSGTNFLFRYTDVNADYGLDWYEVALDHTRVPNLSQCAIMLEKFLAQQTMDFEFVPSWFSSKIDWLN